MVFIPSGGVTFGGAGFGAADRRCSAVAAGCMPTMVDFLAVIGRICGGFARGSTEFAGRAAGAIDRG
jgi:hypothetical protein